MEPQSAKPRYFQPATLFSPEEWGALYPRENFKKSDHYNNLPLHYLIALRQPDANITAYIKKCSWAILVASDPLHHQFTPLHLGVMCGRVAVVRAILDRFKEQKNQTDNLNPPDSHGWTPLHHSVLVSEALSQMLLEAGADAQAKTLAGATFKGLEVLVGKNISQLTMDAVSFSSDGASRPLSSLALEKFRELTGLELYTDYPLYPQRMWKQLWQAEPTAPPTDQRKERWMALLKKKVEDWQDHPPELEVGPCPELAPISGAKELKTAQPTTIGTVYGVYAGEADEGVTPESLKDHFVSPLADQTHAYRTSQTNSFSIGSAMRWANTGFPNSFSIGFPGDLGVLELIVAGQDQRAGDPIIWDYGPLMYHLTLGKYTILNRDAMHAFFTRDFNQIVEDMAAPPSPQRSEEELERETFRKVFLKHQLFYPIHNPAALLDLHFSGKVTCDHWMKLLAREEIPYVVLWKNQHLHHARLMHSLLQRLQEYEQNIAFCDATLKQQMAVWVVENRGELTVMQILKALEVLPKLLARSTAQPAKWEEIEAELLQECAAYNWLIDENAAIGNKRLAEDAVRTLNLLRDAEKEACREELQGQLESLHAEGISDRDDRVQIIKQMIRLFDTSLESLNR